MTKQHKDTDQIFLALEHILEDGMSVSATADMVGETLETVEKWIVDYQLAQDEKIRKFDAEMNLIKYRTAEEKEEIALQRSLYDHFMSHPDPMAESLAMKNWEELTESLRWEIITNANCIDCGATIITDYVMQSENEAITLYGRCGKCGKSMATNIMK